MEVMTLDKAIQHCQEVAQGQSELYDCYLQHGEQGEHVQNCLKCGTEHRQLTEWLKDYKRLLEQEPCGDAISRESLMKKCIYTPIAPVVNGDEVHYEDVVFAKDIINAEPVYPQRKTGHWIRQKGILGEETHTYECSLCGRTIYCYEEDELEDYPYCHCGARMVEPQESEDKK